MNPSTKPTVLIVEDEAGPRNALKVILRPFFTIYTAETGRTALDILSTHHIDLITLDQKLPDRQGIDLLREIKLGQPTIEVVIITGYGSLNSAMDGIRHGAAGYLLKPFNVSELVTLINQTLEKKQRLDCLRDFLNRPDGLWTTEKEAEQTWKDVQDQYFSLAKATKEKEASFGKHSELAPLLSDLLEAKDKQLVNHAHRVKFYATLLANSLNVTPEKEKALALGAFLHDIGYISLDHPPVSCAEPLLAKETEALKRHPEIGARMLLSLGFPAEVGQIVSYHHEHFDGSGYPYGLKGEGIPLPARIVSLAQTFDNLTTERYGRPAVSVDEAITYISTQAGSLFDPKLTETFTKILTECKASLPALAMPPGQPAILNG